MKFNSVRLVDANLSGRLKYLADRARARSGHYKRCVGCGKLYRATRCRTYEQKYCGVACYNRARNRNGRSYAAAREYNSRQDLFVWDELIRFASVQREKVNGLYEAKVDGRSIQIRQARWLREFEALVVGALSNNLRERTVKSSVEGEGRG